MEELRGEMVCQDARFTSVIAFVTGFRELRSLALTFVRNRGELAEGWYDPATLQKALESAAQALSPAGKARRRREEPMYTSVQQNNEAGVDSSDDDAIGPSLPNNDGHYVVHAKSSRSGPTIPSLQDLELQQGIFLYISATLNLDAWSVSSWKPTADTCIVEFAAEDSILAYGALRNERVANRKQEKDRLEELAPRAEAGSKERVLEKKREKADRNRAFASAKTEAGGVAEVPESDLLGDDDGGVEGFKNQRKELERKKNEREIRREEVQRARAVEREERVKQYKEKEEATMKGLVELARVRFG